MGAVKAAVEEELPGVEVYSIFTGRFPGSEASDVFSSLWGNANDQVDRVCQQLAALPQLARGFAAVGFSQGSQLLRATVQRCQHLLPGGGARVLVSVGGQQQGVMELPGCAAPGALNGSAGPSLYCRAMEAVLSWGAYAPIVQRHVIQAQYFKDPFHLTEYRAASIFLADINLEGAEDGDEGETAAAGGSSGARRAVAAAALAPNTLYRDNLISLQRLVLYKFEDDDMVVPKESSHFGVYSAAAARMLRMEETTLYQQDRIGLRALNDSGRLALETVPGRHMQFSLAWFRREVVRRWLAVPADESGVQ